jgi:hypothetical protein
MSDQIKARRGHEMEDLMNFFAHAKGFWGAHEHADVPLVYVKKIFRMHTPAVQRKILRYFWNTEICSVAHFIEEE